MNDLQKLFISELRDMYDGEHQLVEALSEMQEKSQSAELKNAFREHLDQTKNHVTRLEKVFQEIGEQQKRKSCKGIEGIIDEAQTVAREFEGNSALDAALITSAQKAEHYEITSYGSLCTWAKELGLDSALNLLKENLSEEKATDEKLAQLAETVQDPHTSRHDADRMSERATA